METSQPLACTESFSYSWLITGIPDILINPSSFRNEYDDSDFNFDFPVVTSPAHHFADADDIFSDGQIKPTCAHIFKISVPSSPLIPFYNSCSIAETERRRCDYMLGKWRRRSKKLLHKCLRFVCNSLRKSSRVDDLQRKVIEVGRWRSNSVEASPNFDLVINTPSRSRRNSNSNSVWCDDAHENSIHEAILYCKRSTEN